MSFWNMSQALTMISKLKTDDFTNSTNLELTYIFRNHHSNSKFLVPNL